jgi:hypothetical protein
VKSGAGELIVEDILHKIRKEIFDGIYKKIYKRAFALKKEANSHAARYNLRSGLQLLVAGFSSKNISHVFESGYQTVTN